MIKHILLASTVTIFHMSYAINSPSFAEEPTPPPTVSDKSATETSTIGAIPAETSPTPPPSEAVIPAQRVNEVRAENLIGTTVFSTEGEKVGTVKDILFDTSGKATGVVLSVGGIMGLGAKSVGLTWEEVDLQPQPKLLQVKYTEDQLEAAPTFKTQEAQQAEADAIKLRSDQSAQPLAPAPLPSQTPRPE